MRYGLDLSRLSNRLVRFVATFGVDEMGSEDGVDERRFPQSRLTDENDLLLLSNV